MKKTFKLILFGLIIFIGIPIAINFVVLIPAPTKVVEGPATWVNFYGSYLGGVIGGIASILGIWLTIKYTRERDIENNELEEEKKRLSLLPYLQVRQVISAKDARPLSPEIFFIDVDSNDAVVEVADTRIDLENVGNGSAVNINIRFADLKDPDFVEFSLPVGGIMQRGISVTKGLVKNGCTYPLFVTFEDLLGKTYRQIIYLTYHEGNKPTLIVNGISRPEQINKS